MVDPRPKRRSLTRTLLLIAAVLGPGFITASAGNDVGGIATYSAAGAQFGYSILWVMIPLAVALIVVQEMSTRMGCVTGKGLAALFRENFGVKHLVLRDGDAVSHQHDAHRDRVRRHRRRRRDLSHLALHSSFR